MSVLTHIGKTKHKKTISIRSIYIYIYLYIFMAKLLATSWASRDQKCVVCIPTGSVIWIISTEFHWTVNSFIRAGPTASVERK